MCFCHSQHHIVNLYLSLHLPSVWPRPGSVSHPGTDSRLYAYSTRHIHGLPASCIQFRHGYRLPFHASPGALEFSNGATSQNFSRHHLGSGHTRRGMLTHTIQIHQGRTKKWRLLLPSRPHLYVEYHRSGNMHHCRMHSHTKTADEGCFGSSTSNASAFATWFWSTAYIQHSEEQSAIKSSLISYDTHLGQRPRIRERRPHRINLAAPQNTRVCRADSTPGPCHPCACCGQYTTQDRFHVRMTQIET